MEDTAPLKLRARRAEDYEVLSALLQDALIPASEMDFLADQRRFVAVANRFRWERAELKDGADVATGGGREHGDDGADARFEDVEEATSHYERTLCGLCFDRVRGVRRRGFKPGRATTLLSLLAVVYDESGVTLEFSGGAAVHLVGRRISCHLEDLGEAWPTQWRPSHAAAGLDDDGEAR
jgi:hypothetical protein